MSLHKRGLLPLRGGNADAPENVPLPDQNVRVPYDSAKEDYDTLTSGPHGSYGVHPAPMEPMPVYMTEAPPFNRRRIEWNAITITLTATDQAMRLGSNDMRRLRAVIRNNDDANNVVLLRKAEDMNAIGFVLEPNTSVEFLNNSAIWARAAAATASVTAFFEIEMDD